MELEEIKNYLRIDGDADDIALESMFTAAVSYIKNTTGKQSVKNGGKLISIESDQLFCMCVKMLIAQWYENRGEQVQASMTNVKFAVSDMLQHIQYSEVYSGDVSDSDTSTNTESGDNDEYSKND